MSTTMLLQVIYMTLLGLLRLTIAEEISSQHPLKPGSPVGAILTEGVMMSDCDAQITICGKYADMKVEFAAKSTNFSTRFRTFEDVTTLSPEISIVTNHVYTTIVTETGGQCRNTTTVTDEKKTLWLTVDVNVTTTREFVPVITTTTIIPVVVFAKAIEHCLIKTTSGLPAPPTSPEITPPVVVGKPPIVELLKADPLKVDPLEADLPKADPLSADPSKASIPVGDPSMDAHPSGDQPPLSGTIVSSTVVAHEQQVSDKNEL